MCGMNRNIYQQPYQRQPQYQPYQPYANNWNQVRKKNIFLIQMFSTQGRKVPHNFDSSEASGDEEDEGEAVEDMDF